MIAHVVQRVRGDKTVVLNPPDRRLHVEGMASGQAHQLRVARHPVIGGSLGMQTSSEGWVGFDEETRMAASQTCDDL